ncbi:MAG: [acyl-carrier-protein] S-malonyltransferase [Planctomycetota bacterium]|nr:MAG: [acyl-carrier-protein] S-malonyltransferase [Planctomycetota bacterium]
MSQDARIAFLFAGQGAQTVGMGRDLYEAYPAVRELYDRADAAVPFDLAKTSFEGPEDELRRTDVSQPAIVVHSLAALAALEAELGGKLPEVACAAGLSLGEYSALAFAGALSLEDTLALVIARGRHMQACCERVPSGMTSVLGLDVEALAPAVEAGAQHGEVGVANDNAPGQVVLSGETEALEAAAAKAKELGARRALPLNVAGAYHSRLMSPAGEALREDLDRVEFRAPRVPVFSNRTAAPHGDDPEEIRRLLVEQVSGTVRWRESMSAMFALGVERCFEFGPGGVLRGLVRRNDRSKSCLSVATAEDVKQAAAELSARIEA